MHRVIELSRRGRFLLLSVTALLLAVCGAVALLVPHRMTVAGRPDLPQCLVRADLYVDTDAAMQELATALRGDQRVKWLTTRTKQQAYEEFKRVFADRPELVEVARPEAFPASVRVVLGQGTDPGRFGDDARKRSADVDYRPGPCVPTVR